LNTSNDLSPGRRSRTNINFIIEFSMLKVLLSNFIHVYIFLPFNVLHRNIGPELALQRSRKDKLFRNFASFSLRLRFASLNVTKKVILQRMTIMNDRHCRQHYLETFGKE
jgi:hypothetical protein